MKADVFFFVTTIAVVICTVAFCVFAYFAIQAVRSFNHLLNRVHKHVNEFEESVDSLKRGATANLRFLVRTVQSVASTFMKPRNTKKDTP